MTREHAFASILGPAIQRYLTLKRALGRQYVSESAILVHLDAFLSAANADLTAESFARWSLTLQNLTTGVQRQWMRNARNLCLYRQRTEPACFVPDPALFPQEHQRVQPHIFTQDEIRRILRAVEDLPPGGVSPLRRETFRLAVVLLYTSGLRRGELLRLAVGDYDRTEHTLHVRESKFHKSRLIPLSEDAWVELDAYLSLRHRRALPLSKDTPLMWNRCGGGRAYTGTGFTYVLRALFRVAEIRTAAGRLPRIHDLRHSFAVQALLRWYRRGEDVQAKLPMLSIYMGHVSITSTEYYLHFVDRLAEIASSRFAEHYGAFVVPTRSTGGER
jgi:integrase